jgi:hypothetical protein
VRGRSRPGGCSSGRRLRRRDEEEVGGGGVMKSSLRSCQEPRRVSNGVIIGAILLSICILSTVKVKYCATSHSSQLPND